MECKQKGCLPITDPGMTRFWITLEQGVEFVLKSLERMVGGELFVPKLPSMNIMDLARVIAPECRTTIIGIRPGEKLHEVMISIDDARKTIEFDNYYLIQPDFGFWQKRQLDDGKKSVAVDFEYNSNTNPWRLSMDEMREMIALL
jgi:UDP-N-acetylglucosamine 4,6-dehydratase